MEFLAILISLGLLQLWGSGGPLQRDDWFFSWRDVVLARVSGTSGRIAVLAVPVVLIGLLLNELEYAGFGLIELVLLLVLLLFSMGRGDLTQAIAQYLSHWRRGDTEGAFEQLREDGVLELEEHLVTDPPSMHAWVRRYVYYRSFERLFAVLFWFVIGGAAGAVLYRLAFLDAECDVDADDDEPLPLDVLHWLEWFPVRLLAISFALTGHFDRCYQAWRRVALHDDCDSEVLLEVCGNASLEIGGRMESDDDEGDRLARGVNEIRQVEDLQRRTLIVWVVAIAVLEMLF